jgi:hypothetical protein
LPGHDPLQVVRLPGEKALDTALDKLMKEIEAPR